MILALSFATFALLALASPAHSDTSAGIRAGLSVDPDQVVFGAHLNLSPVSEHVYIVPSAEAGFGNDATTIAINGDVQYRFDRDGTVRPYAGGGLAIYYVNVDGGGSDTNVGVDILGGIFFGDANGHPLFVDVKAGLTDEVPDWKFMLGINF
jgi:hypothetical protein